MRKHPRRQPKARGNRIEVPGARARAGSDQHLMILAGGDDLVDQRVNSRAATVDEALSANLQDGRVRQDAEIRRLRGRRFKLGVGQRSLNKKRPEFGRSGHEDAFRHFRESMHG